MDHQALKRMIEDELLTQWQAAERLGCHRSTVERACRNYGIKTQRTGPRSGPGHPNWKGGRIVDQDGYVLVYRPDHPHARSRGRSMKPIYVPEHRLVMEGHIGRYLTETEVVHHKDGNRANNSIDNLELFSCNADHLRHELTGRVPNWTPEGKARMGNRRKQTKRLQ